jgi:hypothetical protein
MKNNQDAPRIKDPNNNTKELEVIEFELPNMVNHELGLELPEDLLRAPRIKGSNCEDTYKNVSISFFEVGEVSYDVEYKPGLLGEGKLGQNDSV